VHGKPRTDVGRILVSSGIMKARWGPGPLVQCRGGAEGPAKNRQQDFLVGLPGSRNILALYTSLARVLSQFALTILCRGSGFA
jgi:hypothetical protein